MLTFKRIENMQIKVFSPICNETIALALVQFAVACLKKHLGFNMGQVLYALQ